jgi:isoleucyl-tRNA synthetase
MTDTQQRYRAVPPHVDLPAMEDAILELWRDQKVFAKSLERTKDGPLWMFYEGPPTANGMPGTHHVEARAFKDVFPRYQTMRGSLVPRKAGWDCHGLPVELAVEKELGFTGKQDIEAYGVAEFNARCRASVERHVDAFEAMTERMGYWVDTSEAYRTMDPEYIDSVWWSLQQIFEKGLLVEDHRVTPYCPRCETGLSDHELAQGYETVVDPSVYVRFPLLDGPLSELGAALLVWTTTPWTLVSNTAIAVHPQVTYVAARHRSTNEVLVVAEPLFGSVLDDEWDVVTSLSGTELEGLHYQPPFDLVEIPGAHLVVLADYVTTDSGTGLVHLSPAFGAEDLAIGRQYGLPVVNPIRRDGRFEDGVPLVGGQFFKRADATLVTDLEARGLLFSHLEYEHAYPHCWRCRTPLLYYAQPSWYIRTTAVKDALLRENERTTWYPETIKWGRYGEWLRNNVDWALSRNRFWGTPLPVWRCTRGHVTVVGSRAELSRYAGRDLSDLDPHRPYVDEVWFACPHCGTTATRVPEVIDAWYDSGSMPFAQWGYPHVPGSEETFRSTYPAQFICEGLDQTRGWFYTLMAVGTAVFDRSSYENVLCLGLILAEDGRRMSTRLGNSLEPVPLMEQHGADAVRWFMLTNGSPWSARRIGNATLQEIVRKVLLTYWNTVAFQSLYGRASGWSPQSSLPTPQERTLLDRWALSELHLVVRGVTEALDDFDTQRAGRLLADLVDDLSNWYVRRSRRRFWDGDPAALATLHECLDVLTRLLAPFVPFITERVWQDLVRPVNDAAAESVHLAAWPQADVDLIDSTLSEQVALVRRLVELGRAGRAESGVKTRQPLQRALIGARDWDALPPELRDQVAEELNVVELLALDETAGELVDTTAKANFRALGRRFGGRTPAVASAISAADAAALARTLREDGTATVLVDGEEVPVTADEVILTETPRTGWAVAADAGETVALDLTVTPELRRAGLAREAVRLVQDARKAAGFDVSDRVEVWWTASDPDLAEALREHADVVAREVLATTFSEGAGPTELPERSEPDVGLSLRLRRTAVTFPDERVPDGERGHLGPIPDAELGDDAAHVMGGGLATDEQARGDLGVR